MKKTLILLLFGMLLFGLFGCVKYKEVSGLKLVNNKLTRENNISFVSFRDVKQSWSEANKTYGNTVFFPGEKGEDGYMRFEVDLVSPKTRTTYITNKEEYIKVFNGDTDMNFASEMIVIFQFTTRENGDFYLEPIGIEDDKLQISYMQKNDTSGMGGTHTGYTVSIGLKMKNKWKEKVQFVFKRR